MDPKPRMRACVFVGDFVWNSEFGGVYGQLLSKVSMSMKGDSDIFGSKHEHKRLETMSTY